MTRDVVALIRSCVDDAAARAVRPLLEHRREWEEVASWFEDEASQEAWLEELVFQVLARIVGEERALAVSGPFRPEDWMQAVAAQRKAYELGAIPKFESGLPGQHPQLVHARTSGFILDQYKYDKTPGSPGPHEGDVVLDCGACFGETALWARMWGARAVFSFEPSPSSFRWLEQNALSYDPRREWFFPVPLGLGDREQQLPFAENPDHPGGNSFRESGTVMANVTSLDAWQEATGVVPDFIKMDLEGAEAATLTGAKNVLQKYRPRLAVCLYHHLEDMWRLPRLIRSLVPDYRFWCKKSHPYYEFVLFAML